MTIHKARGYQLDMIQRTEQAWAGGVQNVLDVVATGAGKSFISASTVERSGVPTSCLAHRNELVGQLSMALAREGVRHNVVGAKVLAPQIVRLHQEEFGRSYYDPGSAYSVASVQTLARLPDTDPYWARTGAWVSDEAHHFVKTNAFGKVLARFRPGCRGLGVTATPCRADGQSLGRASDGVFDTMVEGPGMRWLIDNGYLTDYRPFCAQSDFSREGMRHTVSGELNAVDLKKARVESRITGDAVKHYQRLAPGKLTVVFDVDVATATATAAAYRAAGVPAEVLTGEMDPYVRVATLRRFKAREILVLVSVDLISEGFDLPAIECVQFLAATESFSKFSQQFGRALRLMIDPALMAAWESFSPARRLELIAQSVKPRALIIDHVGNIVRHGVPDAPREWTLDGFGPAAKGVDPDAIPLRACACINEATGLVCGHPYERFLTECPNCGGKPVIVERGKPEFVDGDLVELTPEVLATMRAAVIDLKSAPHATFGGDGIIALGQAKHHRNKQEAQRNLRQEMAIWGGWQTAQGRTDRQAQKLFFLVYGIDYLSAQALGVADAAALQSRIEADLAHANVIAA